MPLSNQDCSISPVFQAVARLICSGSPSDSYESEVKLWLFGNIYKRFLCVIQMIAMFICGENAVRKRQNSVRKWQNGCAEMAKLRCIFGVYMLDFLHFGCQGGEMVVRLRRLVVWLRLKFIVLRRLRSAFRAFPTMISRISQSIPPFSPPFYSKSTPYINISHLSKPPYRNSNRRKQC